MTQLSRNVVLVCGSHKFGDETQVWNVLSEMHEKKPITRIVHGDAAFIDTFAGNWADFYGVQCSVHPADWMQHGFSAGPRRNVKMLVTEQPDLVVAFPGAKGTEHMCNIAYAAKVPVRKIR